jgi:SAM-dependent methyltransferase/uncharacterized protein YbaR (Trm112 family)
MNLSLLEILRCPFCGNRLELTRSSLRKVKNAAVAYGTLVCLCCAYPIVSGIPYLRDDSTAQTVMHLLGKEANEKALFHLLGLEGTPLHEFQGLCKDEQAMTFQNTLPILYRQSGLSYFRYRFTDPAFLASQAILQAMGQDRRCFAKRVLDLGGGVGHLTRTLCRLAGDNSVVLANISFPELWLAKRFLAPSCQPICCNAEKPLPFDRETFSLVFSSDVFHYIWNKRLLAGEAVRLIGSNGVILLTHLHNAFCENEAAGMPLPPSSYRHLFEGWETRLFKETDIVKALLTGQSVDLSARYSDDDFGQERALILMARRRPKFFRPFKLLRKDQMGEALVINPHYQMKPRGKGVVLKLQFPSTSWKKHFEYYRLYLPERVELTESMLKKLQNRRLDGSLRDLMERYVLLEVPD